VARRLWSIPVRVDGGSKTGGSLTKVRIFDDEALTVGSTVYNASSGGVAQPSPLFPNAGKQTTLTVTAVSGDNVITVADVAPFALGDRIRIYDGTNTRKRFITAINGGAKTITLQGTLGVGFSNTNTNVGWVGDRGNVSFWAEDTRDYYIEVEDVASGMRMFELSIPISAPVAPIEVQEEGVAVNTRGKVNYIGASVTATDDAANGRVNVTITGLQADGTVSAPSIGFVSDPDTGFYRVGANTFAAVSNGGQIMRWEAAASTVNGWYVTGQAAGSSPTLEVIGSDVNISMVIRAKGTGSVNLPLNFTDYFSFIGGTGTVNLTAAGGSANVAIAFQSKGTGSHIFYTGASLVQFLVAHIASAVNYVQVQGAATGAAPQIQATGTDANVSLLLVSKGTGSITLYSNAGGRVLANFLDVASAVNYVQIAPAATGAAPDISPQGTDANIDLGLSPKGTGKVRINTATVALGGGGPATLGGIGGTGPATNSQNSWLPVRINSTTTYFIPVWT
jgi:hypothetical protein